jgi:hypothetical protein
VTVARIHLGTAQVGPITPERLQAEPSKRVTAAPARSEPAKVEQPKAVKEGRDKRISLYEKISLFE